MASAEEQRILTEILRLDAKITKHSNARAALLLELDKVKYPAQPAVGSTLTFTKRFDRYGKVYAYAAHRVGSRWYTTGSSCPAGGYSWHELVDFIRDGSGHGDVKVTVASRNVIEANA